MFIFRESFSEKAKKDIVPALWFTAIPSFLIWLTFNNDFGFLLASTVWIPIFVIFFLFGFLSLFLSLWHLIFRGELVVKLDQDYVSFEIPKIVGKSFEVQLSDIDHLLKRIKIKKNGKTKISGIM